MTPRHFIDDLYTELFSRGIDYFFADYTLTHVGEKPKTDGNQLEIVETSPSMLELHWLDASYTLAHASRPFTEQEQKLLRSIGRVLSTRYQFLFDSDLAARALDLYRGLPEDRFVSAFLDPSPYRDATKLLESSDRVAEAIAVLRLSSLMTYENRRIATGALLFGSHPDPCHPPPVTPRGAVPYKDALTSIRSFHRLSDGLQTVALVDSQGYLSELIEVQQWASPFSDLPLPVPSPARYDAHSRATLCGGHIFLILTPNGEIKIIANGMQVFNFLDGRWRLTDAEEKYRRWEDAVGSRQLAEIIFTVALNLAESRRGCLFVIVDDPAAAEQLLTPGDMLTVPGGLPSRTDTSKQQLHYLLSGKRALDLPAPVLESVARIDGAIVLSRSSDLLAFGAILQAPAAPTFAKAATEGGRTTAAINASLLGKVLKVSEDGRIAFYEKGVCVWDM